MNDQNNNAKNFAKYSGMGFQLLLITGLGAWLGHWLDGRFHFETPYLSALGAILFLILALYLVLKDLMK